MPHFLVERTVEDLSPQHLEAIGRRANEIYAEMPELRWIRSFVSESEGKMYCEYDAPSPDLIIEASRRAGMPIDRISEVSIEVHPGMFL